VRIPAAFVPVAAVGARGFARPAAREWVERALTRWGSLARAAAHADDVVELRGRGVVRAVPAPDGGRWVVRRYRRGGWIGPVLSDRYLRTGVPRPLREAVASEEARRRGVATPRVIAGVVYPSGLFYRADLVTELVPGSMDLASLLFGPPGGSGPAALEPASDRARIDALHGAGASVVGLARAGIRHRDLNAKNLLVRAQGTDPPRLWVLDLDRAVVARSGAVDAGGMGARLERSLRKFERRTDRSLRTAEWQALARGLDAAAP
jgi:3-deoxy-D-manno-octulosonic acid kinase